MISALGRPFDLGMLYDRRSDKLIPGITLWSPNHLTAARITTPQPYTHTEVFTENAIEDKTSALKIEAGLKLSFLSGLVTVEGAAKYLNDTKTSRRQSRVVLKYETTTEHKQLTMEHLGAGKIQYPDVFDKDIATDVVVGILYGANAFMVFDKEVSKDDSFKEVHGNMDVLVKSLPGISVGGHGSVDITEDQKKNSENMKCKMYGDFRTNESPTDYEDAVKVYKQLPSLIGEKGENAVPIKVYLCSLSNIDSRCQRMVREISVDLVSKTVRIQEHIQSVITECNDQVREEICVLFPRLKRQFASFMQCVELYKVSFQKKILSVLPQIRGGGAEEIELAKIIEEKESSPFSYEILDRWLEERKQEIKKLQRIVRSLQETPVVNPEAVKNELFDIANEHVICCTFKIACKEDEQIVKMNAHINNGNTSSEGPANNTLKMDEKATLKKVRETLRHFMTLKSIHKESNSVKFLATDEPLARDYKGETGAFMYLYEDGALENEDLKSYPKPNNLQAGDTGESTLQLFWNDPAGNNAITYKVEYKKEASTDMWSTTEVKPGSESKQTSTLTGLEPATKYVIRVCTMLKIKVSEYSEKLFATTQPAPNSGNTGPNLQLVLSLCKHVEPSENNKHAVYTLPLIPVQEDRVRMLRKYDIHLHGANAGSHVSSTPNKVIMMVGSIGSEKATTLNAMINYVLGVKWEDCFRLKIIHEDSSNQGRENIWNQLCSETQYVTCYTLHNCEGFKVPYTLNIVDTPTLRDKMDKAFISQEMEIVERIHTFFDAGGFAGINHIDAICFLAQADAPTLTAIEKYIFRRIISMFGEDVKKNISVMFTFADGRKPQALSSFTQAGLLDNEVKYFKFNNSALFVDNLQHSDDGDFDRLFWSLGIKGFEKFFKRFNELESKSLALTKEEFALTKQWHNADECALQ